MNKHLSTIFLGLSAVVCLESCWTKQDFEGHDALLSSWSIDNPKDSVNNGYMKEDKALQAYASDCSNNHTIRIYYNHAYPMDVSKDYKIVAGPRDPSTLAADEVYLEVSTSATDTYISTGTDGSLFHYHFDIYPWPADCENVLMQHYTSVPTTQTARLTGSFHIYPK